MDGCSAAFYTYKRKAVGAVEIFGIKQMIRYTRLRPECYSLEKSGFNIQHRVICYSDVFRIVFHSCHVEFNSAPWVRYDLITRLLSTTLEMACGYHVSIQQPSTVPLLFRTRVQIVKNLLLYRALIFSHNLQRTDPRMAASNRAKRLTDCR